MGLGWDEKLTDLFQPVAAADLDHHSLLATITVLRSVMAAAAQVSNRPTVEPRELVPNPWTL